jgi:hypothetical protein
MTKAEFMLIASDLVAQIEETLLVEAKGHKSLPDSEEVFTWLIDDLDCLIHSYRESNKIDFSDVPELTDEQLAEVTTKKQIKDSYEDK